MGIKRLSSLIRSKMFIKATHLTHLFEKKIVIDASIYMYKFEKENSLISNIYHMCSLFKKYNIIPLFVFDGKYSNDKRECVLKRKELKRIAYNKYNRLSQLNLNNLTEEEQLDVKTNMNNLKKEFVYITPCKISKVKEIITNWGYSYYTAKGEADELCAQLVNEQKVWACMSDDTDLFVYGCKRVIKNISLFNETYIMYTLDDILDALNILTHEHFKTLCALTGADYINTHEDTFIQLYNQYQQISEHDKKTIECLYSWLNKCSTINLLDNVVYNNILNIYYIENISLPNIEIKNGYYNKYAMKNLLLEDGFIFPV